MKRNSTTVWHLFASLCLLWAISTTPVHAALPGDSSQRYFVCLKGSDESGTGTLEKPWRTIHKALSTIPYSEDDAAIVIRGGTYVIPKTIYFDALRGGSEGKFFTVTSYKDEEVIIDGSLLTKPFSAMALFSSTAYVRLQGLTFTNLRGAKSGIYIEGTSHHIRIINNKLHDMTWVLDPAVGERNLRGTDNLNPITVIGNHPTQSINNILIRGNTLSNIVPGYSEAIKITGNVTDFVVSKNFISNIATTGITAAGNHPWVVDSTGTRIPNEVNHARNGVIKNNVVHNAISTVVKNSAGIYLDGARYVTVKDNTSYSNTIGFSVRSAQPGDATGNTLINNIAYGNADAGLVVGTVHPGAVVNNTTVSNNEFRNNSTKVNSGEMTIQRVNGLDVNNNLFSSSSDLMIVASEVATNLKLKSNLYYGVSNDPNAATFDWSGITQKIYVGLLKFQEATCHDLKSAYQDATNIGHLEKIKGKSIPKSGRNNGGKNKALREVRRACYKATSIW